MQLPSGATHSMQEVRSRGELALMLTWDAEDREQLAWRRSVKVKLFSRNKICKPAGAACKQLFTQTKQYQQQSATSVCFFEMCALCRWMCFTANIIVLSCTLLFLLVEAEPPCLPASFHVQYVPFASCCSLKCVSEQSGYKQRAIGGRWRSHEGQAGL